MVYTYFFPLVSSAVVMLLLLVLSVRLLLVAVEVTLARPGGRREREDGKTEVSSS